MPEGGQAQRRVGPPECRPRRTHRARPGRRDRAKRRDRPERRDRSKEEASAAQPSAGRPGFRAFADEVGPFGAPRSFGSMRPSRLLPVLVSLLAGCGGKIAQAGSMSSDGFSIGVACDRSPSAPSEGPRSADDAMGTPVLRDCPAPLSCIAGTCGATHSRLGGDLCDLDDDCAVRLYCGRAVPLHRAGRPRRSVLRRRLVRSRPHLRRRGGGLRGRACRRTLVSGAA